MLVLSRRIGETICIGSDIEVEIIRIRGNQVRIGITAPREVGIRRSELDLSLPNASAIDADYHPSFALLAPAN